MNPNIKTITLDKENKEFYNSLKVLKNKVHLEIYSYIFGSTEEHLLKKHFTLNRNTIFVK